METKSTPNRTPPALKPCPFCGKPWEVYKCDVGYSAYIADCTHCNANLDHLYKTHSAAVRAANRRAK